MPAGAGRRYQTETSAQRRAAAAESMAPAFRAVRHTAADLPRRTGRCAVVQLTTPPPRESMSGGWAVVIPPPAARRFANVLVPPRAGRPPVARLLLAFAAQARPVRPARRGR